MSTPHRSIPHHFAALKDPRVDRTKKHNLADVLVIALCAVVAGADSFDDIEVWGNSKRDWLGRFLGLPNGIPSHDTFNRAFAALDPHASQDCFIGWMDAVWLATGVKRLQIDGKSLRRSRGKGGLGACLHLVSVWAAEAGLTLGQEAIEAHSNEIPAIPPLLRTLELGGAIVTIDAAGCQKEVARTVREQGGHYVLAVKANQERLYQDIQACFDRACEDDFAGVRFGVHRTREKGHGRVEGRLYTVIYEPQGLRAKEQWQGLKAIVMVHRRRQEGGKHSEGWGYYVSSAGHSAKRLAEAIRGHWGIENGLHWVLDVVFAEDHSRVRSGHAAQNLAWVRQVALSLLTQGTSKGSLKGRRQRAGWDDDFLLHLLGLLSDL